MSNSDILMSFRLSRARRCIENCFGILASRWRVYRQTIIANEETINAIIKASVILHNFVKNKETEYGTIIKYIIFIYESINLITYIYSRIIIS